MRHITFYFALISFSLLGANTPYEEALKTYIKKGCSQKKENIYLSKKERALIEMKSKTKVYGGLALRYITTCPQAKVSYHYVDSHIVRTQNETIILTISNKKIDNFEVTSFNEPLEYLAPKKWYDQFDRVKSGTILKVREQIDGLSGATLTVNASVQVTNKLLALHDLLLSK